MRALCKTWTEGSPAAFAVLDGLGDWTGDNQLCITQEGHTPFIGQWTTVTNWTNQGSPYLWWTGPDQAAILQAVVNWGLSAGLLGRERKVGIIAGDRASDQLALNDYLLPDLRRAGVTPVVETIASDPSDTATTDTQAPLVVQQLRSAGVTSVIPLIPFNVFYPVLQAETAQQYFPKLLLSDYESSIESALGLLPVPYAKALDGQEGVTTETLGGDRRRPARRARAATTPGSAAVGRRGTRPIPRCRRATMTDFIEEQGPVAGLVPGHPPVRHRGQSRRARSQPAHLRHRHVQDHRLPRHLHPGPQLRPGQALRADRVPGGEAAHQLAPVDPVQAAQEQHPPVHLLGQRPAVLPLPTPADGDRRPCGAGIPSGWTAMPASRGGRPASSTRSIPVRSPTPTATAPATCPGIIDHLDHLQWLGIDGIWLSPITVSPNADWGYDVADYLAVDPDLGTSDDLDRLIAEAGRRGIRVLMDLVPNHTSEQHPWFVDARSSAERRPPLLVRVGRSQARRVAAQQLGVQLRRPRLDARSDHRPVLPAQPPVRAARPQLVERRGPPRLRRHPDPLARPGSGRLPHRRVQRHHQGRPAPGQPAGHRGRPFEEQLFGQRSVYNANRPEVHDVLRGGGRWSTGTRERC